MGVSLSSFNREGASIPRTYTIPFPGFAAVVPQFEPPLLPGIDTDPRSEGGV